MFAIPNQLWAAYLFWGLGTSIMARWALKKHAKYKREFKDYPKNRKAIFPFIL
jgi:very-long-chain enoyl-CoA reductase